MKTGCFSIAALDYFPGQKEHFAGGNALNQAIRYRHLGFETAFIGAVGPDEAGQRIQALLKKEAVDCSHMRIMEGATACNVIVNDENGERFGVDGAWQNGVYGQFRLSDTDWDYLQAFDAWSTHANCPDYLNALQYKKNQWMCVDFLHLKDYELLEKSLDKIQTAFFGGTPDMEDELARVSRKTSGLVVLTLGAMGSVAFQGSQIFRQKALPLEKVIDTTGCGDAFQAGFTASYLKYRDIQKALRDGSEQGRIAASFYGGVPW